MAGDDAMWEEFKLYHYTPSLVGNIIFVVIFAVATIAHVVLLIRKKTWYFIPFVVGCTFEAVGYIGRVASAKEAPDYTLNPYLVQTLLILLGPALLAASIYMVLGRLIRLLDAHEYSVVRTNWLTKIFVTGDVLSFLAQSAGGGILAKADSVDSQKMGENVILGGLGIQIAFFGFFIVTTVIFHVRIAKNPTPRSYSVTGNWKRQLIALYASSVLIMVRSVFRMIEFGAGYDSILMKNEVYLLVLDGLLMFLVAVIFVWSHPSSALRGYKEVIGSVESNRESAIEGIGMLPVSAQSQSSTLKVPGYDSDPTALRGYR